MKIEQYHKMALEQNYHWWFEGRKKIINTFIKKFSIHKSSKILDIGAGTGSNINILNKYGKLEILEPNDVAINYLQKKNPTLKITKGKCPEDLNFKDKFDLICLFDVLEHIENDAQTINKLHYLLNAGGRIFITVPSYKFLWTKHDEEMKHFRRYSKKQLKKLFINNFSLEYLTHFNTILFPAALIDRLIKKIIYLKSKNKNSFLNYIFYKIFSIESFLLKFINFPFGLSMLIVVKKK